MLEHFFPTPWPQACEYYERSVQELVAVERHLLQARAKALTEEEKALAEKRQAFHGYTVVDTPTGMYILFD